jgi:CubicO group peptidase (beta-lactamase class C family)
MVRPQTGDLTAGFTPGSVWGLGWGLVQEPQGVTAPLSPGTYGHGGAFGTQGWVDPRRELILVLLIQRVGLPNSDGSAIRGAFTELAVGAVSP